MPSNSSELQKRRGGRLASIKRTKHNIVIFKVFTDYADKNITKQTLIEQFSSFGKIQNLTIVERQYGENTCKVIFQDPKSAALLLRNHYINLNHSRALIKPSPFWEQPLQVTDFNEYEISNATSSFNEPQFADDILRLDDYCLEMIFDYLDLSSQLRLSSCHERFETVFVNMICPRIITQQLVVDDLITGQLSGFEIWQLLKTAGHCITTIKMTKKFNCRKINISPKDIYQMIEEFCTNLQRVLFIERAQIKLKLLNYFNISMLTEIELYRCNIKDADFRILLKCRNLTSLGLGQNRTFSGSLLPHFRKLQRLSLYNCKEIEIDQLMTICANMKLKYLDIRNTTDKETRSEVLEYCTAVESLKMSLISEEDLQPLLLLTNLRSLEITRCTHTFPFCLGHLLKNINANIESLKLFWFNGWFLDYKVLARFSSLRTLWLDNAYASTLEIIMTLKELEELNLYNLDIFEDSDMTHFLDVIRNCHKLKHLCITRSYLVRDDVIYNIYEILENRRNNTPTTSSAAAASAKSLTIFLYETGVKPSFIKAFNISHGKNKLLILRKFSNNPLEGLLSADLPFHEQVHIDDETGPGFIDSDIEFPYESEEYYDESEYDDDDDDNDNDNGGHHNQQVEPPIPSSSNL